ncbi:uncharacterized protein SAPINGB_P005202 [Magnusiomyces paraingens]|uniref:J domain-containing protein n=1 Tax=Magnusiomyces paraingens TaxID=2606893 RepID=A0A5E8BZX2_9ASCO|nr:uncharacterized protein SAPINGB_P005202 [Saprochaete ingens]VVT56662.1 unnamed protein product [Saprochaete ingens]
MKTFHIVFLLGLLVSLLVGLATASPEDQQYQRRSGNRRSSKRSGGSNQQRQQRQQQQQHNPYDQQPGQRKFNQNWSSLDREIFHLNEQIRNDPELGPATSFYSWLDISKRSSQADIDRAYKQLSRKIHPDKVTATRERALKKKLKEQKEAEAEAATATATDTATAAAENDAPVTPKVKPLSASERKHLYKDATDRFARLGLVYKILSDTHARERYDFFLDHGFPKLKGADYFYSRYRPGTVFVFVFIFLLVSAGQYVSKKITVSRHRRYMLSVIDEAKALAWPSGIPAGNTRGVVLDNGKEFHVHPDGQVYLLDTKDSRKKYLLDPTEIVDPVWSETIIYTVPIKLYKMINKNYGGRKVGRKEEDVPKNNSQSQESEKEDESDSSVEKKINGAKQANKMGGRRRK